MYKKVKLTIIIYFITNHLCFSQFLSGNYVNNKGDYIDFLQPNKIRFKLHTKNRIFAGCGEYKINKKRLNIKIIPRYNLGSASIVEDFTPNDNLPEYGNFKFYISSIKNVPLKNIWVSYSDDNVMGKVKTSVTDSLGKVEFKIAKMPKDSIIEVFFPGLQSLVIPLSDLRGGKYNVRMFEGEFYYVYDDTFFYYKQNSDTLIVNYRKDKNQIILVKQH